MAPVTAALALAGAGLATNTATSDAPVDALLISVSRPGRVSAS
jgi:hypothetical protein